MTENDNGNRQPVIIAATVASIVMLAAGIGYRVLAAKLSAPVNTPTLSAAALERLPMQLGDWTGEDEPLDEALVRATDTDAHVSRTYSRQNSMESVWLYIAYGVRVRDLMPHRPEVCYAGAGWTLEDRSPAELALADEMKLPCNVLKFSRGVLNQQRVVVLDYYIVDGQYCHDVSLLRSKVWRGSGAVDHVAQVQIVASATMNPPGNSAERTVLTFAVESASSIAGLFETGQESRRPEEGRLHANDPLAGD